VGDADGSHDRVQGVPAPVAHHHPALPGVEPDVALECVRRRAHNDPTFPRPFRPAGTKQLLFWLADVEAFLAGGHPDEAD
jgi:hypothetical protein